jgi:hypothetical protein
VLIKDNVLCDYQGGDAFQFLDKGSVFNRIVAGLTDECKRSLEVEAGSVSVIGLDLEYSTETNIHIGNADAPIALYSSQIESTTSVLTIDGPANLPLPILVKNWRVAANSPSFQFQNQSLGPLNLENNDFESIFSPAYIIGTGSAFASGSTLLSLGNFYFLDSLSSLNTPFGPGPQRIISAGDVGTTNNLNSPSTLELPTIIEGPRL